MITSITKYKGNKSDIDLSKGFIYIAIGLPHLILAIEYSKRTKMSNPEIPISIFTNIELKENIFEEFVHIDIIGLINTTQGENRLAKLSANVLSPFEKTAYIDTDAYCASSINSGFKFLDWFDICARSLIAPKFVDRKHNFKGILASELPHWNCGFLLFNKNKKTSEFFKDWRESYNFLQMKKDQFSFAQTILTSDIRVLSLDTSWNSNMRQHQKFGTPRRMRKIIHQKPILSDINRLNITLETIRNLIVNINDYKNNEKECKNMISYYSVLFRTAQDITLRGYRSMRMRVLS